MAIQQLLMENMNEKKKSKMKYCVKVTWLDNLQVHLNNSTLSKKCGKYHKHSKIKWRYQPPGLGSLQTWKLQVLRGHVSHHKQQEMHL